MNLSMAFDNSFVVMNEEEMYDVNGGYSTKERIYSVAGAFIKLGMSGTIIGTISNIFGGLTVAAIIRLGYKAAMEGIKGILAKLYVGFMAIQTGLIIGSFIVQGYTTYREWGFKAFGQKIPVAFSFGL